MSAPFETAASLGIVPVIAIDDVKDAVPLADALLEGGLPIAEITFRTAAAAQVIAAMADKRPELLVGAGTILTPQALQSAIDAGARFGLAPQQAQLLLAIRVRPGDAPPSISDLASALQIRQHSAVGLANRAQRAGLVTRSIDPHDQRVVRIGLTPHGRSVIAQLAESHLTELQMVAATLQLSDEFLENLSL